MYFEMRQSEYEKGRIVKLLWVLLVVVAALYWLLLGIIECRLLAIGKVSDAFVLFTYASLIYIVGFYTVRTFLIERRAALFGDSGWKGLKNLVVMSVLSGVALEFLTLFGAPLSSPLALSDWGIKRTIVFTLLSFVAISLFSGCKSRYCAPNAKRALVTKVQYDKRDLISLICITIAVLLVLSYLAVAFDLSMMSVVLFGVAIALPLTVIAASRRISIIPEWVFLSIAIPVGLVLCILVPPMTGASWDDQIHFKNALNLSYVTSPEITNEEQRMSEMAIRFALGEEEDINLDLWPVAERRAFEGKIDEAQQMDIEEGQVIKRYYPDQLLSFTSLGYLPSAIGLWTGRLLHLPFSVTLILGRVANLIAYCAICFCAIRISPVKKVLFVVIALIPESIFLASNYSYDPWLTGMILLGIAILFREMWGSDKLLDFSQIAMAALVLFLGLGVKAVYFPIIGLFFLMPPSKFSDGAQRRRYYLFVVLFGLFVLASFALPFLFNVGNGAEVGDLRGGSEVSSSEQLKFILEYAGILLGFFVSTFFNPSYSSGYLLSFSYLSDSSPVSIPFLSFGSPLVNLVPVLFLIGIALFDNEDGDAWRHAGKGSTAWAAVIYLGTYILVATALYISFTPVGYETVNGCQLRYQLPILAPMLAVLLNYGKPLGFKDGTKKVIYLVSLFCLLFWTFVFVVSKCVV